MRGLPGVESATVVGNRIGGGWSNNDEPIIDGVLYSFDQVPLRSHHVGPDFLHVIGIPLLAGRDILDPDTPTPPRVVVVYETFVKKPLPHTLLRTARLPANRRHRHRAGVPLSLLTGHFMGSMLYQLQPYDASSLGAAVAGILVVSLAAGFIPGRRAASIDPVQAPRTE
jgi:hypothetical protein